MNTWQKALGFSMMAGTVVAVAPVAANAQFVDVQIGTPQAEAIENLVNLKIASGVSATQFAPTKGVTRAEAAMFIVKALELDMAEAPKTTFKDTEKHWANAAIATMVQHKIMNGYNETNFGPNDVLTRGQMAKVLTIAFKLQTNETNNPFVDAGPENPFSSYITNVYANEIAKGVSANTYGVNQPVTREQMALFLNRTPQIKERVAAYNNSDAAINKSYSFKYETKEAVIEKMKKGGTAFFELSDSSNGYATLEDGTQGYIGIIVDVDTFEVTQPGIYYIGGRQANYNNTWLSIRVDATDMNNIRYSFIDQNVIDDIIAKNPGLTEFTERSNAMMVKHGKTRTIKYEVIGEGEKLPAALISSPARRDVYEFYEHKPLEFVVTPAYSNTMPDSEYHVLTPTSKTNAFAFDLQVFTRILEVKYDGIRITDFKVLKGDASLFKWHKEEMYSTPVYVLEGAEIAEGTSIEVTYDHYVVETDNQGNESGGYLKIVYTYQNGQFVEQE